MTENKTLPTNEDVLTFLSTVEPAVRRQDGLALLGICREATGVEPRMWGPSIVGFGMHHYVYASGREGDTAAVGFSPRKAQISLYLLPGVDHYEDELHRLGKHTTGKGCIYIKRLSDINVDVLREMVRKSFAYGDSLGD